MLSIRLLFVEYWHLAQAQFKVVGDQVKAWDEEIEVMKAGNKHVFECISFEPSKGRELLPGDPPPRSILDWCRMAWSDFKEFAHSATNGAVVHALAQLRSHYPVVDLQWVVTSYARGTDAMKIARLEDEEE